MMILDGLEYCVGDDIKYFATNPEKCARVLM
jgi:hypothetical protein